ncbi:response regulator transcription factor [Spirosoma pulveris]
MKYQSPIIENLNMITLNEEQSDNNLIDLRKIIYEKISKQEMNILYFLYKGNSNKEIANRLNISEHTVKVHKRNIFKKLGIKGSNNFRRFLLKTSVQFFDKASKIY